MKVKLNVLCHVHVVKQIGKNERWVPSGNHTYEYLVDAEYYYENLHNIHERIENKINSDYKDSEILKLTVMDIKADTKGPTNMGTIDSDF